MPADASDTDTWEPPLKFEERLKALLPPRARIAYLYNRNLRNGEPELHLISVLSDKRRVSIDVGANKGVYSYALRPHSKAVHAFEPNPKLFRVLRSWAHGQVELHPEALSNVSETADLLVPRSENGFSNQGASLSATKVSGDHRKLAVRAVRFDDLGIRDVGFMKIDVEGFEREVLEGAADTLRRDRPNLLIEMEEAHTKVPITDMVGTVTAYGYSCFALVRGTLTPFARLDPEKHHRSPACREDYVFNFIFLPV
ncbi:MAG: FkbM family methyltransferase [Phenylobacterium sp.]|nr:FkbM family methyltransferase [Phenylobacterium sp.]